MIKPCYYKGERGNKPYELELMLRLFLLQNLYDLADEATVVEVIDSRAFPNSVGWISAIRFQMATRWDAFRNLLVENGFTRETVCTGGWASTAKGTSVEEGNDC